VADTNNDRVQQFTSTGMFIRSWGGTGTGDGQFDAPVGIEVDADGDVWVADRDNDRLQVFTADGTFRHQVGGPGSQPGQFTFPNQVAVSARGSVYVADVADNQVTWFARPLTDARIRRGNGSFVGNDRYNLTGANQTRTGSAARGRTVTFSVSIQNDVPDAEAFRVKGTAGTNRFRIRYFAGNTNITDEVEAGNHTTAELGVGTTAPVRVVVTVLRRAPRNASITGSVTVRADSDPDQADRVRFTVRRK
jgi:hypothetical protein